MMTTENKQKKVTINKEEVRNRSVFVIAVLTVQILIDILCCGLDEHIRKARTNRAKKFFSGVLLYIAITLSCTEVEE